MREVHDMVNRIARNYAARCWWAELNDLVQEGWVAAMQARKTWRPPRTADDPELAGFVCYAGRAVALHLRDYLWRASAPVSGPRGHGEKLAGLYRAPLDSASAMLAPDIDESPKAAEWWDELDRRMAEVIHEVDDSGAAARVILRGEDAGIVAYKMGWRLSIPEIRARTNTARRKLRKDTRLLELVAVGT